MAFEPSFLKQNGRERQVGHRLFRTVGDDVTINLPSAEAVWHRCKFLIPRFSNFGGQYFQTDGGGAAKGGTLNTTPKQRRDVVVVDIESDYILPSLFLVASLVAITPS